MLAIYPPNLAHHLPGQGQLDDTHLRFDLPVTYACPAPSQPSRLPSITCQKTSLCIIADLAVPGQRSPSSADQEPWLDLPPTQQITAPRLLQIPTTTLAKPLTPALQRPPALSVPGHLLAQPMKIGLCGLYMSHLATVPDLYDMVCYSRAWGTVAEK